MLTEQHIELINKLGFSRDHVVGMGMQAVVLNAGDQIVKLYLRSAALPDLARLRAFYDSLDASSVNFAVPSIHEMDVRDDYIVVREAKLHGWTLDARALNELSDADVRKYIAGYVDTLFAVRKIKTDYLAEGEIVTQIYDDLNPRLGTWHRFLQQHIALKRNITHKWFLAEDVSDWDDKVEMLLHLVRQPYTGEVSLIHGDFFPGNVMVDEDLNVTALVDFGTLTTRGDALWDVITGWAFIDMYNEVSNHALKAMVMEHIRDRLSEAELNLAYAYLMMFSLMTSNLYAPNDRDGHYWWCVDNLNNEAMWSAIEAIR